MAKPKLTHLYSNIFTNFATLQDSNLFSPERFTEILTKLDESQFKPAILQNGREIKGWWAHELAGHIFSEYCMTSGKWSRNQKVLEDILTIEEIEKLNNHGNAEWSRANDEEKFNRATKVKSADWSGPVLAGDDYFESVEDYLDSLECDDLEYPDYIWGADEITPTLQLDATEIFDRAAEQHDDLNAADFKGFAEFDRAVKEFVEKNKERKSWYATGKVAVLLK